MTAHRRSSHGMLLAGDAANPAWLVNVSARSLVSIENVGFATAFLAHDAMRLITGTTLYVDGSYHIID